MEIVNEVATPAQTLGLRSEGAERGEFHNGQRRDD